MHEAVEGREVQSLLVKVRRKDRERLMRVDAGAAEARKVLEASADAARVEPVQEVLRRLEDFVRVRRRAALPEDERAGALRASVDDGREVDVEAEQRERGPGEIAQPARRTAARRGLKGRRGGEDPREPIDRTSLLVDEEEARARLADLADQRARLLHVLEVAAKQDDAVGGVRTEDRALGVREARPGDADAEEAGAHAATSSPACPRAPLSPTAPRFFP